jgi:hypothetical protein
MRSPISSRTRPAQAAGADDRALRQFVQRCVCIRHEGVAGFLAFENGGQKQALGELHRHVLDRVCCDIRAAFEHALFEFLDEQALAADFCQRRVQNLVALGGHGHQLDFEARVRLLQAGLDVFRLP